MGNNILIGLKDKKRALIGAFSPWPPPPFFQTWQKHNNSGTGKPTMNTKEQKDLKGFPPARVGWALHGDSWRPIGRWIKLSADAPPPSPPSLPTSPTTERLSREGKHSGIRPIGTGKLAILAPGCWPVSAVPFQPFASGQGSGILTALMNPKDDGGGDWQH